MHLDYENFADAIALANERKANPQPEKRSWAGAAEKTEGGEQ